MFIAGGATYSESRSCYEISKKYNRDVILGSTDMLTPTSFIRELSRTRESRQSLNLNMDQMRTAPPPPPQQQPYQSTSSPPQIQGGLPPRPAPVRMGIAQGAPGSSTPGSRNGAPNAMPGGQRLPVAHAANHPSHGISMPTSHGYSDDKKEKKKKKFGVF